MPDEKNLWSIDGALAEKARQWEEEAPKDREPEEKEHKKLVRCRVDDDGDH